MATPTAPIALAGDPSSATARIDDAGRPLGDDVLDRLRRACNEVIVGHAERAEASRDWWPLAMIWALEGQVPALASCVCRPADAGEVAAVLSVCNEARVPVTAAGSGMPQCAVIGCPGQTGQTSLAASSQTVNTKCITGACAPANSLQLLLRSPRVRKW